MCSHRGLYDLLDQCDVVALEQDASWECVSSALAVGLSVARTELPFGLCVFDVHLYSLVQYYVHELVEALRTRSES